MCKNLDLVQAGFTSQLHTVELHKQVPTQNLQFSLSQVFVKQEQNNPAVAAQTAPYPSLLTELMLATPGLHHHQQRQQQCFWPLVLWKRVPLRDASLD